MKLGKFMAAGIAMALGFSCGSKDEEASIYDGTREEVKGAILSETGSQSAMQGYMLALVEKDTGVARVASVNDGGVYTFKYVKEDAAHTLVLLNKDYKLASVLSMASNQPNTVAQFFTLKDDFLPPLIHRGEVIQFQELSGIDRTDDLAADADRDGVPSGVDKDEGGEIPPALALNEASDSEVPLAAVGPDTDNDNTPNQFDVDIDGDGLINWFDTDMDNTAPIDAFDADADNDLYLDNMQDTTLKAEYSEGARYFGATVEYGPLVDGKRERHLVLRAALFEGVENVSVEGSRTLFGGAVQDVPCVGDGGTVPFNERLYDNGCSEDGASEDLRYGARVILSDKASQEGNSVVFLRLKYGSEFYKYYPYVIPDVDMSDSKLSFAYQKADHGFALTERRPFGSYRSWRWQIKVFRSDGNIVWESDLVDASDAASVIRIGSEEAKLMFENAEDAEGGKLELQAVSYAYSQEYVPGYPSLIVRSAPLVLND